MAFISRKTEKFTREKVLILWEIKKISREIKKISRVFFGFYNTFSFNLNPFGVKIPC
jgi:hypothetical protein